MGLVESRNEDGKSDPSELSDGVLLSQLIQLLHRRPKHSLPLADLSALLPNSLRKRAQEHGGLQGWIRQYHSLFQLVGEKNQEVVVLSISSCIPERQVDSPASEPQQEPDPSAPEADTLSKRRKAARDEAVLFDEENQGHLAIQLRGLPYKATVEDIRNFLGHHSQTLQDDNPVHLVLNRDGRPSGFARVMFGCEEAARAARDELHLKGMEDRYVEVFLYPDRPSKGKNRRLEEAQEKGSGGVETTGMTLDVVINECRTEMAKPGKRRMLLSMLGVNLSPGARAYLKQMDQGLKHFLANYPTEFVIEGNKGCEYVAYVPTPEALARMEARERQMEEKKATNATPGSPKQSKSPPEVASSGRVPMTPSDWGTPAPGAQQPPPPAANFMPPWPGPGGAIPPTVPSVPTPADLTAYNNWAALAQQGQIQQWQQAQAQAQAQQAQQVQQAQAQGWNFGWPNEEGNGNMNFLDPQAIATAVFYGAQAAVAAATAQAGYVPPGSVAAPGVLPQGPQVEAEVDISAIRLRGLPYAASEQDVLAFFAQHDVVDRISDVQKAVNILQRSNGRPSGQAIVQMRDRADAELAQRVLNGQWMGNRYIEVFLHDESQEGQNALAAVNAASTAAAAQAKYQVDNGNGAGPLASNLPQAASQAMANYAAGGMWPGQMSDGQNPEWQALFSFLGDGQRNGGRPGAPLPNENGDSATSAAVV